MSQCNTTFDLKINLAQLPIFHGPVISLLLFFAVKNIKHLVLLAKRDSGELHCPATALTNAWLYYNLSREVI